jgi:hypothetical protein
MMMLQDGTFLRIDDIAAGRSKWPLAAYTVNSLSQ